MLIKSLHAGNLVRNQHTVFKIEKVKGGEEVMRAAAAAAWHTYLHSVDDGL